jgi:hypothetical protein
MRVIVDTNVPKVANGQREAPHATPQCIATCTDWIHNILTQYVLVLDDNWHILGEYSRQLRSEGYPGVGDAFLKWVLTNQCNPKHCEQVHITEDAHRGYAEFPNEPDLDSFDSSDRKFVAVARTHPEHPSILNAVDTGWWDHRIALERHGIRIEFLCPDHMNQTSKDVTL